MKTASHTPTPWRIKDNRHKPDSACDTGFMIFPEKGNKAIGRVYKGSELSHSEETQEANAAFIVRACNSHDALVSALVACCRDIAANHAVDSVIHAEKFPCGKLLPEPASLVAASQLLHSLANS